MKSQRYLLQKHAGLLRSQFLWTAGLVCVLAACHSVPLEPDDGDQFDNNKALSAEVDKPPKDSISETVQQTEATQLVKQNATRKIMPATTLVAVEPAAPLLEAPAKFGAGIVPVALLLPLTGIHAEIGQLLLDAAQLALFDLGDKALEIRPYDTAGDPKRAAQAAHTATIEGAALLLGPVFSQTTVSAAKEARKSSVNLVSFSNDQSVAGGGAYLMGLSPQQQIKRIIKYARVQGIRRYAALIPESPYGIAILRSLRDSINRAEGDLVTVEFYLPDISELDAAVQRLSLTETRSYDAILVPEGGDRLRAFAALLPHHDIHPELVQYIGTTLWSNSTIGKEPALIGAWFPAPNPDRVERFRRKYFNTYQRLPPRIATLVYDSVALAAALARQRDFSAKAISEASGFSGVAGIFRFSNTGAAERGLAVLEVTVDGFKVLSKAPITFENSTN